MENINSVFNQLLNNLSKQMPSNHFDNLFDIDTFSLKSLDTDKAVFVTESTSTASIIKNSYLDLISKELETITGSHHDVEVVDKASFSRRKQAFEQAETSFFKNSHILPQYTFDNFVTGSFNREAWAAAMFSIDKPGASNPIFLYSKSGLGKTHLLHAIGNEYKVRYPDSKVLYITADDFVSEFVRYIRGNKNSENLKDFFSSVDILMVDDIQFLTGKEDTQVMFFNIFNLLVSRGKQIVLTSDRSPAELKGVQDRLVSRFAGGLSVGISTPDKSTLLEILKQKIITNSISLDFFEPDVLDYLALNYSKNIRELEGSFTRLLFAVTVRKPVGKVTLRFARSVFEDDERRKAESGKIDINTIIRVVAENYNLTEAQLKSKVRTSQIAYARQIAMYLARSVLSLPFQTIGKEFGKDHTTVMSNVQKIQDGMLKDATLKNTITNLTETIQKKATKR